MKSKQPLALFVTPYKPNIVGNGGNHRAYQIVYDLKETFGEHNVFVIYYYDWFFPWYKKIQTSPKNDITVSNKTKVSIAYPTINSPSKTLLQKLRDRVRLRTRIKRLRDIVQLRTRIRRTWKEARRKVQLRTRIKRTIAKRMGLVIPKVKPVYINNTAIPAEINHPLQGNILASVSSTNYHIDAFSRDEFVAFYQHMVEQIEPDIVIIEHSGMKKIIDYNRQHSIPTVICPQNLEGLDTNRISETDVWSLHARMYDLASEYMMMERCDRRLFISRVEAGFIQGLGCSTTFYPYRAVGEIYERMRAIRVERAQSQIEQGLFLMIGSAHFAPIGDGMRWLVQEAAQHGLPEGIQIVVVGNATDKLLPSDKVIPNLVLKGWTEQAELDQLMLKAQGVLVPYRRGFGALTRLSELPLTGIPVIASEFATRGIERTDGIFAVENSWACWCEAMKKLKDGTLEIKMLEESDDHGQTSALQTTIRELLGS